MVRGFARVLEPALPHVRCAAIGGQVLFVACVERPDDRSGGDASYAIARRYRSGDGNNSGRWCDCATNRRAEKGQVLQSNIVCVVFRHGKITSH